jgi:hypothetical protein
LPVGICLSVAVAARAIRPWAAAAAARVSYAKEAQLFRQAL